MAWRAGTCIEAHGVRLGLRTNTPELLDRLESCLPPGWRPCRSALVDEVFSVWVDPAAGAARPSRVYVGARRRARTRDLHQAFAVLESEGVAKFIDSWEDLRRTVATATGGAA